MGKESDSEENDTLDFSMTPELAAEFNRRIEADRAGLAPAEDWATLREKLLRGEI